MQVSHVISLVVLALAAFSPSVARTDAFSPQDPGANLAFCQIARELREPGSGSVWRDAGEILRLGLEPARYGTAVSTVVRSNNSVWADIPALVRSGRNIVISIGAGTSSAERTLAREDHTQLREVRKELSRLERDMRRLARATTVEACLARARARGFSYQAYLDLKAREASLELGDRFADEEFIRSAFAGIRPQLRLRWELVPVTTLAEAYRILSKADIRNAVIVSHALPSGQLVDAHGNGYPATFLNRLPQGLLSLSLFSCHAEKAEAFHDVASRLASRTSAFGATLFSRVLSRPFLGREDVTPLFALGHFLKEVDRRVAALGDRLERRFSVAPRPDVLAVEPEEKSSCRLRIAGVEVRKGMFGVFVDGEFIGTMEQAANPVFDLACPRSTAVSILVRDLSVRVTSVAQAEGAVEAVLQRGDQSGVVSQATVLRRSDGNVKSLKFVANAP